MKNGYFSYTFIITHRGGVHLDERNTLIRSPCLTHNYTHTNDYSVAAIAAVSTAEFNS